MQLIRRLDYFIDSLERKSLEVWLISVQKCHAFLGALSNLLAFWSRCKCRFSFGKKRLSFPVVFLFVWSNGLVVAMPKFIYLLVQEAMNCGCLVSSIYVVPSCGKYVYLYNQFLVYVFVLLHVCICRNYLHNIHSKRCIFSMQWIQIYESTHAMRRTKAAEKLFYVAKQGNYEWRWITLKVLSLSLAGQIRNYVKNHWYQKEFWIPEFLMQVYFLLKAIIRWGQEICKTRLKILSVSKTMSKKDMIKEVVKNPLGT